MVLNMARPWKHPKTGIYWFRKRVPDYLRGVVGKWEEKFSLKTRDPNEARRLHVAAAAEVDARWRRLVEPKRTVTQSEAVELARPIYANFVAAFAADPKAQLIWDPELGGALFEALPIDDDLSNSWTVRPDEFRRSEMKALCDVQVDALAASTGLTLDDGDRLMLRKAVAAAFQAGSLEVGQRVAGIKPSAFLRPASPAIKAESRGEPVRWSDLITGWSREARPAEKTTYMWSRVVDDFIAAVGHDDAAQVTAADVISWKDTLLERGLSSKTVRHSKLAPIAAILKWAVANQKLSTNPAEKVTVGGKAKPGEGKRGYTDEEAKNVLVAARGAKASYVRWLPWLCAFTGARVSELAQLRREDVREMDGIWVLHISPDAGSIKNAGSERRVPVHSALLAEGFVQFVLKRPTGPLFVDLTPDRFGSRGGNATKVVSRWVRALGVDDPRLSPSHGWRHRFKSLSRRHNLSSDVSNALLGHAPASIGDRYGEIELSVLKRELDKIPGL